MAWNHLRYEVTCDHCRVSWTYPGNRDSREVKGPWEKRASFRQPARAATVSLDIMPLTEGTQVQSARIHVNGVVRAEHRGRPGEPTLHVRLVVPFENLGSRQQDPTRFSRLP